MSVDLKWSISCQSVSVRLASNLLSIDFLIESLILIIFIVAPVLLLKSSKLDTGTCQYRFNFSPTSRASFDKTCRHGIIQLTICFAYYEVGRDFHVCYYYT